MLSLHGSFKHLLEAISLGGKKRELSRKQVLEKSVKSEKRNAEEEPEREKTPY